MRFMYANEHTAPASMNSAGFAQSMPSRMSTPQITCDCSSDNMTNSSQRPKYRWRDVALGKPVTSTFMSETNMKQPIHSARFV